MPYVIWRTSLPTPAHEVLGPILGANTCHYRLGGRPCCAESRRYHGVAVPDKSRSDERLRHSGGTGVLGMPWGGGRRKESCPGLNDPGGPRQVRSGHIAREMGQPCSGAFDELHGEWTRLNGSASHNHPVRVSALLGPAGAKGGLDPPPPRPSIRRGARALPWSIKVCGRGGGNGLTRYWHWADRVQVHDGGCGPRKPRVAWTFIPPARGTIFLLSPS